MSRKTARDAIFKIIFEECVTGEPPLVTTKLLLQDVIGDDLSFMGSTIAGISAARSFLKYTIVKNAVGFALERIYKIDLAILLVAAYEIIFTDVPEKVAISEAVELAKIYSTDKSAPFINGLLATIMKEKVELKKEFETYVEEEIPTNVVVEQESLDELSNSENDSKEEKEIEKNGI